MNPRSRAGERPPQGRLYPPPTEGGPARLRALDKVAERSQQRGSAGGRSARVSGPGGCDGASACTAPLSSPASLSPHPGPPAAARGRPLPSPSRGGWPSAILLVFMGAASLAAPEPAQAACSVLSHHPCTPYFGSGFRHQPFTPYSGGVFSP